MICSMTGYATATKEIAHGSLTLELRTVNNRYLDVQFRLPDDLRQQESAMRKLLTTQLSRGKVECRFNFSVQTNTDNPQQLDTALLNKLQHLEQTVHSTFPNAPSLTIADILQWPGMLSNNSLPIEEFREASMDLLQATVEDLVAARAREGDKLKSVLLERTHQMRELLTTISPRIPDLIKAFEEKLRTRLEEAIANLDDDRIRQEITIFAGKIDIDEELTRLQTHLDEIERILNKGGAAGKRLDFMMQELNREANTIGAKSVNLEISKAAMAFKVLIEQMREQVQNIE
jgi:uncharacterized protein (TIGR00255 family)